jgi:hypothetical protein
MKPTRALPFTVSLGLALCAVGSWSDQDYITDKNGCRIVNPSPKPDETVSWSGSCEDGFAAGQGTMQWYDKNQPGVRYDGTVVHGALSGQGKLTLPDGTTYEGGWLDGKQQGTGTLTAADGARYEGEWSNGQPDGRGAMRASSGETVQGIWKDGLYVGPAKDESKPAEEK